MSKSTLLSSGNDQTDIQYLTGFSAPDDFLLLSEKGEITMLVSPLEAGRAKETVPTATVLSPKDLVMPPKEAGSPCAWALALLKHRRVNSVVVSSRFPASIADRLRSEGKKVLVSTKPLFPQRAIKTKTEIKAIKASQEAAVAGMQKAISIIRQAGIKKTGELTFGGLIVDSDLIRRHIDEVLLNHNCAANETIVACGPDTANPHEKGHGPLRIGEPIIIDIFPRHRESGYWGDLTRTIVKGHPKDGVAEMFLAVKQSQELALSLVKPGAKGEQIHRQVENFLARAGFPTEWGEKPKGFFHGTGHSVGLDIHESPGISRARSVLKTGNVITIEPGLYYPDKGGVRIEDTVEITTSGWRYLCPCEKDLLAI